MNSLKIKYIIFSIACLFAATAHAQVGIGNENPRGVLDVNNPAGYGNTSGVVLPVVKSISAVRLPSALGDATTGTVVFDSTANCIRLKRLNGWTDCLLDEGGYRTTVANILSVGADFKIKTASMGPQHTLCIGQDDNAIYAAGDNSNARTGIGRTSGNCQTFMLIFAQPCVSVAAGDQHSIAVDVQGQVWTWGNNGAYRTGLPDDPGTGGTAGNDGNTGTPTLVRLTNGDTVFSAHPTSVHGKAIMCAAGALSSYVLTEDGKVWRTGTLGTSTTNNVTTWTEVTGFSGKVTYIAASTNTVGAVTESGAVYTWGEGADGRLGTGNGTDRATPVQITMPGSVPISKIAMGFSNGAAISADSKQLFVWGTNRSIGVGSGTTINAPRLASLPGFNSATDSIFNVAATRFDYGNGGLAVATSIGAFTTGENNYGQLGIGSTADQTSWQYIVSTGIIKGTKFTGVAMSGYTTLFLTGVNPIRAESSYVGYGAGRINYRQLGAITIEPRRPMQLTK
ncbi:MAG: hypothetical protein LBS01_01290 [Prevotellaceae bacterium]|jgi:alpha-tubulin suppressor-like RCC1 family protein|nr:hypothetical protein [Prevotellaceae bacterium]